MRSQDEATGLTRRTLLRTAAVGGITTAAGVLLAGSANAGGADDGSSGIPGVTTIPDTSHADPELVTLLTAYFRDKSAANPDATMSHFSMDPFSYIDATLGEPFPTWASFRALLAKIMPTWGPSVKSYPTRILGDATSGVVFFTDTKDTSGSAIGVIGAADLRAASVVDLRQGLIVRNNDYWDGRHFGLDLIAKFRATITTPFPTDFRESIVGEQASYVIDNVANALSTALSTGDFAGAAALFAPDGVFEDVPAKLQLQGQESIQGYLSRIGTLLPYAATGATVRHVVGSAYGGGYEWVSTSGPVTVGLVALELDANGLITRSTAMWDGSLVTDQQLAQLMTAAIEH